MIIEYCSACRNRIDAADLRSGLAGSWLGGHYCGDCFGGLEDSGDLDQETTTQAVGRTRRLALRRRAAPRGRGRGLRIRAAIAGAVVSSGTLMVAVASCGTTPAVPAPPSDVVQVQPPVPAPFSLKQATEIEVALEQLRERRRETAEFAQRRSDPAGWTLVDERWSALLASKTWQRDGVKQDARAVALRADIERARGIARDRFEVAGNEVISRAVARATAFASKGYHREALKALGGVAPIFVGLPKYAELVELQTKIEHLSVTPRWEPGVWVDITPEQWRVPAAQSSQKGEDAGAGAGATVIDGDPKGVLVIFTPAHSSEWKDYVVEMEAFVVNGAAPHRTVQLGMRVSEGARGPEGKAFGFRDEHCNKWITLRVEVKGGELIGTVDGAEAVRTGTGPYAQGKPLLLVNTGTSIKIRSARYQVN